MDDSVPTEDEIKWAVKRLCNHLSGGPSRMQTEYLKMRLAAARKTVKDETAAGAETTEDKETTNFTGSMEPTKAANWEMVVDLVQTAFREGRLAEVVAAILNCRIMASITFHDLLNRFWAGHGTGTTTLKAKLIQQLAALREEVLYVIFLDLHKAYESLDRSRGLEILEGYGVGPQARRLLQTYWRRLTMVARAGGYYRTAFRGA